MKISYDQATDALYLHLADSAAVDSEESTAGVVLDYDINGVAVGIDVQQASQRTGLSDEAVKCMYLENEDVLQIRLSYKTIVREASPDWHTNISYAEDGTLVEIVLLDAKKEGLLPVEFRNAA
jgi:uncharacterized protein YuzE